MLPCHGGRHLPLHLAAHLHPRAAARHDRHRVLTNPLPHRAAHQLAAAAQGAATGRGECGDVPVPSLWGTEGRGEVLAKALQAHNIREKGAPQFCLLDTPPKATSVDPR